MQLFFIPNALGLIAEVHTDNVVKNEDFTGDSNDGNAQDGSQDENNDDGNSNEETGTGTSANGSGVAVEIKMTVTMTIEIISDRTKILTTVTPSDRRMIPMVHLKRTRKTIDAPMRATVSKMLPASTIPQCRPQSP